MMRLLLIILCCIVSLKGATQISFVESTTEKDSLLVLDFWNTFRKSILEKDAAELETVLHFPFYCHQCLAYVESNDKFGATVKVSRKLYHDSIFQLFYDIPTLTKNNQNIWKDTVIFYSYPGSQSKTDLMFRYEINELSNNYESSVGFIYLIKRNGKYFINGLDTVP